MISPKEIIASCLKWWEDILILYVTSQPFVEIEITRIGRVTSKDILSRLSEYKMEIETLKSHSKEQNGIGYRAIFEQQNFNKIKEQLVPVKIVVETIEDYLAVVGKNKEYERFKTNCNLLLTNLPQLRNWIVKNPLKLIDHTTWPDTIKVCQFFLTTPKPNLYIRQLPIPVHTKYIQKNEKLVESLLNYLIADHVESTEKKFEKRFHLKYAEPLIRVRFLDQSLFINKGISDMSVPLTEFCNLDVACDNIFVTENLMNFLTLPTLKNTIALWSGGGFSVSNLSDIEWISNKQFYYWGDIDSHGFLILHQFKGYFKHVEALMMDENTLDFHIKDALKGKTTRSEVLDNLTQSEQRLYNKIRIEGIRLEQEKISQVYANKIIFEALNKNGIHV